MRTWGLRMGETMRLGRPLANDISPCLRNSLGDNMSPTVILSGEEKELMGEESNLWIDRHLNMGDDGLAPTLCAKYGTGGNNMPCVMEIGPGNLPVLHNCQLWDAPENDKAPCLRARMGTGGNSGPMIPEEKMGHYVVRRITPTECERLQGFPDGHTDIGEWTDKKGKLRQTTDAARYKALGNSMAVPCMKWIAQRIDWALANPITEDTAPKYDYQPEFF